MDLTVRFLGLCLFRANSPKPGKKETVRVYLPKAYDTHKQQHKDKTNVGDNHVAEIVLDNQSRIPLANAAKIEFLGDSDTGAFDRRDISRLVRIGCIADDLHMLGGTALENELAAFTTIAGGKLKTINDKKSRDWHFRKNLRPKGTVPKGKLGLSVEWVAHFDDGVDIAVNGSVVESYDGRTNRHICIVNVCVDPLEACDGTSKMVAAVTEDVDFKWFYNLMESNDPLNTITDRLSDGAGGYNHLPVPDIDPTNASKPRTQGKGPVGVDTPTCICGFFCNCEDPDDEDCR